MELVEFICWIPLWFFQFVGAYYTGKYLVQKLTELRNHRKVVRRR